MNVNTIPSAQAPTPAHKANGASVRAREQADAEHDAGNGMGFMAMLQTFTDPDTESAPSADQTADAIGRTLQAAVPVPPAPIEAAGVQRHAGGAPATPARASGQHTMPGLGSVDVQSDAPAAGGLAPGDHAIRNAASADGGLTTRTLQMALSDSSDKALQFSHAAAQAADHDGAVANKGHAAKELDASMLRPLVPAQASAGVVSMFEAGLAGLRTSPGARGIERGQDRHLSAHAAAGFVAWADAAPSGTSHQSASPVYAPTASTPVPAAALAQKMHYWVAGGVQNAELQLDAFGGGSVDVRIAVKGDEATVTFRSDQPQARQLLLEAMPQLKELLAGEGLVLSGGFVGGSAQDPGHGTGHSSDRLSANTRAGGGRDAQVPAPTMAAVRSSTSSAVDLFV